MTGKNRQKQDLEKQTGISSMSMSIDRCTRAYMMVALNTSQMDQNVLDIRKYSLNPIGGGAYSALKPHLKETLTPFNPIFTDDINFPYFYQLHIYCDVSNLESIDVSMQCIDMSVLLLFHWQIST